MTITIKKMKDITELLESQYQSFINEKRDWDFFLGLADYVEFIKKTPIFKLPLNNLKNDLDNIKEKEDLILKINEIEKSVSVIEKEMSYHLLKREQLEKDEIKLCEMVLERYQGITEDEIKEQLHPYLKDLK